MRLTDRAHFLIAFAGLTLAFAAALFAVTSPVINGRTVVGVIGWAFGGAIFFIFLPRTKH